MTQDLLYSQPFIHGQWHESGHDQTFAVLDPATADTLTRVTDCTEAEAERAIASATEALKGWRRQTADQRARILEAWYELIMAHQAPLAELMTRECGKPLAESTGEVGYGASFIRWFAAEGRRAYGEVIPTPNNDRRILTLRQPIGVCTAITPWNFPLAMITRKVAPALAAGCTMVVKPAEATPLTALALAELGRQAGLPPGVLNVVTASRGDRIGQVLTTHPEVRKVSFTGSTAVGKTLLKQAADGVRKVSLELGGNAPFIVFDDADLDAAVAGAIAAKYRNTGQTCVCTNRFLVQSGVYDAFAEKLAAASAELSVGAGLEDGVKQGPLINDAALQKVERMVADATGKGARVLTGGARHKRGGNFYQPTVLADATPDMEMAREEIFGPVSALYRFETDAEAVAIANDTPYGLAAYFYSRDMNRIWRVSEALEYGMVGINEGIISTEVAPFGGVKESGLGREGSRHGLDEYTELKYLCMGGLNPDPL